MDTEVCARAGGKGAEFMRRAICFARALRPREHENAITFVFKRKESLLFKKNHGNICVAQDRNLCYSFYPTNIRCYNSFTLSVLCTLSFATFPAANIDHQFRVVF